MDYRSEKSGIGGYFFVAYLCFLNLKERLSHVLKIIVNDSIECFICFKIILFSQLNSLQHILTNL